MRRSAAIFDGDTLAGLLVLGVDRELSMNAVASALANLESAGYVEVRRDRRPYRYRGCP